MTNPTGPEGLGAMAAPTAAERLICLDGVAIAVAADRIELELADCDLMPANHPEGGSEHRCLDGEPCHPLMHFHDGTTIYLHCPPEGEEGPTGYHVSSPRQHRWAITFIEDGPALERVARLTLDF